MEDDIDDLEVILRSYQRKMLDISLRRNAIVVMPTGSGKTHVAVARVRSHLEGPNSSKITWFMANSVELSHQHYRTLTQHLPSYRILSLTGADGVDTWTEQRLWDAVLNGVNVMVGTPAVLSDALTHGFVRMSQLGLLVFDEAHHCIKDHPMNSIMKRFYHPNRSRSEDVPQVLGLTASPSINPKAGSLEVLEFNLNAIPVTPRQSADELNGYVYPPKVSLLMYGTSTADPYPGAVPVLLALNNAAIHYDFASDPYIIGLKQCSDDASKSKLLKAFEKQKTHCSDQIRTLDRKAATLFEQVGEAASQHYTIAVIQRVHIGSVSPWAMLPDSTTQERQHLIRILTSLECESDSIHNADPPVRVSPKTQQLISMLQQSSCKSTRGIIFVKERATAVGLAHQLCRSTQLVEHFRIGAFVGTSSFGGRRSGIADLAEPKQQRKDLEDFRSGAKNLMVATSVLEEGIDVSACNLVVNFDLPDTLIAFIQRRGRARQQGSHYYMFVGQDNGTKADPLGWEVAEVRMKEEYTNASRDRAVAEAEDHMALETRVYHVQATGALLTLATAKSHLYHFCSVSTLQASNYITMQPEFHVEKKTGEKPWSAVVTLPAFVHPALRTATSRECWRSESAAIKDAAFEAYVALHRAGLVNDNLLPLLKDSGPESSAKHPRQPSLIEVSERRSCWTHVASLLGDSYTTGRTMSLHLDGSDDTGKQQWHESTVTVVMTHSEAITMTMFLPAPLVNADDFLLHWNEHTSYSAHVSRTTMVNLTGRRIRHLQEDTSILLRSVHSFRMLPDAHNDFPVLFSASQRLGAGCIPALDYCNTAASQRQTAGLVSVAGRGSRSYILRGVASADGPDGAIGQDFTLTVTPFPKRRDFLHAVPERETVNVAYSTEEKVSARECTIDHLDVSYTIFAALVPSILHRLDVQLSAQRLQTEVLRDVNIYNTKLIVEAISAPAAAEAEDYNRFEYLGDSILKLCAHLQVTAQYPTWPERHLSNEKERLVSNATLTRAALKLGLDKYVLTKPFTGAKWRPLYVHELLIVDQSLTRQMSSKTLADVIEALVGAAFVDGGLTKAYSCIQTLLPDETWCSASESFHQVTSELAPCNHQSLDLLEHLIGHRFTYRTLLVEAITHASLPFQHTGMSYERLEFLGDAVLDLIVVPKLHTHPRKLKHYEMHTLHSAFVNGLFLGFCCMEYGVERTQQNIIKTEDGHEVQSSSETLHLHDFLRASGQLHAARRVSVDAFVHHRDSIRQALSTGTKYPWVELTEMGPQKFISDMVESALGALYIDTRGGLGVCEAFLERLGISRNMQTILENQNAILMPPKERLGVLAGNETLKYIHNTYDDGEGRRMFGCTVQVGDSTVSNVHCTGSRLEAEVRAADSAADVLQSQDLARKRKLEPDVASDGKVHQGANEDEHDMNI